MDALFIRGVPVISKKMNEYGDFSIVTDSIIYKGDIIFTENEILSDESEGWIEIPYRILGMFNKTVDFEAFNKYCYNVTIDIVRGPISLQNVIHESNYIDHSCDPNVGLDEDDNWVALSHISKDDYLSIDYGTILFSSSHDFSCRCGSRSCRGKLSPDDWKKLCLDSSRVFPSGAREFINKYMMSDQSKGRKIFSLLKKIFF